jgi:hypothetical protein
MKIFILYVTLAILSFESKAQTTFTFAPVNDTIQKNSWQEAMDITFGLLPKSHYPTGYLLNKAAFPAKFYFANGLLNDSSFNMLEFYFLQNITKLSYNNPDSIISYLKIDSIKNAYINTNNILPWGVVNMNVNAIKDSAFVNNYISVSNHRFVEQTSNVQQIYRNVRLFCSSPLNLEVNTLNPHFVFRTQNLYSNSTYSISKILLNLDDGYGFRNIYLNTPFEATYATGGYKKFVTKIVYSNGDTLYSRSELDVIDNSEMNRTASVYQNPDDCFTLGKMPTVWDYLKDYVGYNLIAQPFYQGSKTQQFIGTYPTQFSPSMDADKYAEACIWFGCGNIAKKIRKPYVFFSGYNPKNGKSLVSNNQAAWINNSAGPVFAIEGWRGPLYETFNGFFTDASKNAANNQNFGDNGNRLLDKLRQEGYDVIIVRMVDGIGYLQNNAFIAAEVLKFINKKILTESDNVTNPGSAPDPEAPGYPNTTVLKKAKHELVVGGASAGALTTRMALLLMEFEHENDRCNPVNSVHRTKTWVAFDIENQGSNTPIGFQMFLDFQKSLAPYAANVADIANSILASTALGLIGHNGVATQNTLYHFANMNYAGNSSWNVGHHSDFDDYFGDLSRITPTHYPSNLKGYPNNCYRIVVAQGSANGITQVLASNLKLIENESPSTWCANPAGTAFGVGSLFGFGSAFNVTAYRKANARVLNSWNNNAFTCKFGLNVKTIFYSWHINFGHSKYHNNNTIIDQYFNTCQTYDEAAGSTLPSHLLLASKLPLSSRNLAVAAITMCNSVDWNDHQHGFSPTVSGLDLHTPGNNTLPRLPNLSLVPGNVSGGFGLMQQNNYNLTTPGLQNFSPNSDFGFPHLTFPTNHYDYTPFDAIWANTSNNINYDDNTMHVEDPNPLIGEFLVEEIAPTKLYLSNRTIRGQQYTCNGNVVKEKYYADFEARNSVLAGNQDIYQHYADLNNPQISDWSPRKRTSVGDFIIEDGAVVTIRANNYDNQSWVTLGAGFSAKEGSIFRAYVFTDPNMCGPFSYARMAQHNAPPETNAKEVRPIISTKLAIRQSLKNYTKETPLIALYPNPTNSSVSYFINSSSIFSYFVSDVTGKKLIAGILNPVNGEIDISTFDKGVYFITIESATVRQTNRIILQ